MEVENKTATYPLPSSSHSTRRTRAKAFLHSCHACEVRLHRTEWHGQWEKAIDGVNAVVQLLSEFISNGGVYFLSLPSVCLSLFSGDSYYWGSWSPHSSLKPHSWLLYGLSLPFFLRFFFPYIPIFNCSPPMLVTFSRSLSLCSFFVFSWVVLCVSASSLCCWMVWLSGYTGREGMKGKLSPFLSFNFFLIVELCLLAICKCSMLDFLFL